MTNQHGGRRDNTKRRPDDGRGGKRVAGEGKKLGRPKKTVNLDQPFLTKEEILKRYSSNELVRQCADAQQQFNWTDDEFYRALLAALLDRPTA